MSRPDRAHEALSDIHPVTGVSIEVLYAVIARKLWLARRWWPRRRDFAPDGPAHGTVAKSYSTYCDALGGMPIAHNSEEGRNSARF